jgi:hypothetical protein
MWTVWACRLSACRGQLSSAHSLCSKFREVRRLHSGNPQSFPQPFHRLPHRVDMSSPQVVPDLSTVRVELRPGASYRVRSSASNGNCHPRTVSCRCWARSACHRHKRTAPGALRVPSCPPIHIALGQKGSPPLEKSNVPRRADNKRPTAKRPRSPRPADRRPDRRPSRQSPTDWAGILTAAGGLVRALAAVLAEVLKR